MSTVGEDRMTGIHGGKQANRRKIMSATMIRRLFGDKSQCYISQLSPYADIYLPPVSPKDNQVLEGLVDFPSRPKE